MEKKQTAVQWLAEQMLHPEFHNPYIEQALQMEREQIEQSYNDGAIIMGFAQLKGEEVEFKTASEYYTQTFKP